MSLCFQFFWVYRSGISGSYGQSVFNFLRNCQTFPQWLYHFIFPFALYEDSTFSTSSPTPFIFLIFKFNFIYFFIKQVISHQFYTHQCIHVNPNCPIHHPTIPTPPPAAFPPWCPYVCSLHLCLNFCPANRFICTIFLGSTYMH